MIKQTSGAADGSDEETACSILPPDKSEFGINIPGCGKSLCITAPEPSLAWIKN